MKKYKLIRLLNKFQFFGILFGGLMVSGQHNYDNQGVVFSSDGNVSIGTFSFLRPDVKLYVKEDGSSANTWRGRIVASGANKSVVMGEFNNLAYLGAHNSALNRWEDLYIPSGKLQIGSTTLVSRPDVRLLVREDGSSANTWRGRIVASGANKSVVMGEFNNLAYLGAHNAALNRWEDLFIPGGNVGIGTTDTKGFKLGIKGKVAAEEVKVALYSGWSDFVFDKNYDLPTIEEVENYINEKGHLKDIPSAKQVEENGIFLGEMDSKLLQKIEELTLYTIQQQKEIEKLKSQNKKLLELQSRLEKLESEK